MKLILKFTWLFWSLNLIGQTHNIVYDDLATFTKKFTTEDLRSSQNKQTFVDSTVQVSNGIHVEISLITEEAFWTNGQLKFCRYYQNNTPFGIWKYYEEDGALKYTLQHFQDFFTIQLHFKNNNIRSIRKYYTDVKKNVVGCYEENYYPDGSMQSFGKKEPKTGLNAWELQRVGKWKFFFPSGKIESIGNFKEGFKKGKWFFFGTSGSIKRIVRFKNGTPVKQKEITS